MMKFSLMVAADKNLGIGKDNDLPWHLPTDFKYFKRVTAETPDENVQNAVIMGRKTWESIPMKRRPLPGRLNVILTRNPDYEAGAAALVAGSFEDSLRVIDLEEGVHEVFVIGGGKVFHESIAHPNCKKIYITEIDAEYDCDTFFPEIPEDFEKISESDPITENDTTFRFVVYQKKT